MHLTPFRSKLLLRPWFIGFLDAHGLTNGAGIGNPNVEFSPDVSTIALAALGGTAYVAWGYRNGAIAVTYAPSFMEFTDRRRTYTRCAQEDAHDSQVSKVVFCDKTLSFVSGGWDGAVKLWTAERLSLLWDSGPATRGIADPCVELAYDSANGVIVAAFASGSISTWTGLSILPGGVGPSTKLQPSRHVSIPAPSPPLDASPWDVATLSIAVDQRNITILHHGPEDAHISRIVIPRVFTSPHSTFTKTVLGDGPLGSLTALAVSYAPRSGIPAANRQILGASASITSPLAVFAAGLEDTGPPSEFSFVVAGDVQGRVCIWDLEAEAVQREDGRTVALSLKHFQAHDDEVVTAITLSPFVWVTGRSVTFVL